MDTMGKNRVDHGLKPIAFALAAAIVVTTLKGCGGGGGSDSSAPAPVTLDGTVASGAPLSGAIVTVTDATGATATTTAGADGSYAADVTGMTSPFVVVARGVVGTAEDSLVSVQTSAGGGTTNVTPLTNAIAATLSSSGNPIDLATNIASEKANITATQVDASEAGFRAALGGVLTAVGASGNLITTKFAADGTSGMDKVLDLVQVNVQPAGEIQLQTIAAVQADDQGANAALPGAPTSLVLPKGTLPSASDSSSLPAPAAAVTFADLENIRQAVQACFAAGSRGTIAGGNLSAACAAAPIDGAYLHQGRNAAREFDDLLADPGMDGATFLSPTIIRQLSATKVLVQFPFRKVDGFTGFRVTVAENLVTGWTLVGNHRDFELFVNGFANRRIPLTAGQVSRLETGISLFVRNDPANFPRDADVQSANVSGPGLPGFVDMNNFGAGLTLVSLAGCDFMSITANACSSLWRLRINRLDNGAEIPFASLNPSLQALTANPYPTDTVLRTIQPNAVYKWSLTLVPGSPTAVKLGTTTVTYWDRLRSRPLTNEEIVKVSFLDMTADTQTLLTNFTGGGKPMIAWTRPSNAAPAYKASFFHGVFSDFQNTKLSDTSATISCAGNANCNPDGSGNYKANMSFVQSPGVNFSLFQLLSRNKYDTQIFSQYTR